MINLILIYEAFSKKNKLSDLNEQFSVWLVPGNISESDLELETELFLEKRGIILLERSSLKKAEETISNVKQKFTDVGFKVKEDTWGND